MNELLTEKLSTLQVNYERKTGRSFRHFFCPILQRDEAGELCRGHVINAAFRASDRTWTVQRSDVDSFYGAHFEAEFVLLQERGRHRPSELLADAKLRKKLHPTITVDGRTVAYYQPIEDVPDQHTEVVMEQAHAAPARLALKLLPSEVLAAQSANWEVGFERDLRLPALVALLKAAHLTMFSLLDYDWGASPSGHFIGREALGSFFDATRKLDRSGILERADAHFRQFVNLVRPITSPMGELRGTISDGHLYLCTGNPNAWAFLVIVRTNESFHGVLLPTFEDGESTARFLRFMCEPSPRIHARLTKFAGDRWEVSTREQILHWPQPNWE